MTLSRAQRLIAALHNLTHHQYEDLLPGGRGDDRPDSDFDPIELTSGIAVELEHVGKDRPDLAKEIAKDHLSEDPHYYRKLKLAKIMDEPLAKKILTLGKE